MRLTHGRAGRNRSQAASISASSLSAISNISRAGRACFSLCVVTWFISSLSRSIRSTALSMRLVTEGMTSTNATTSPCPSRIGTANASEWNRSASVAVQISVLGTGVLSWRTVSARVWSFLRSRTPHRRSVRRLRLRCSAVGRLCRFSRPLSCLVVDDGHRLGIPLEKRRKRPFPERIEIYRVTTLRLGFDGRRYL